MGAACGGCQLDVTRVTLHELKKRLEGDRRRVQQSPEVYVTIEQLVAKDGAAVSFSPHQFSLQDIEFHVFIEVIGTAAELAQLALSTAAGKAADKCKLDGELREKATHAAVAGMRAFSAGVHMLESAVEKIAPKEPAKDARSFRVIVTVNLQKDFGADQVVVTLRDFKTGVNAFETILSSNRVLRTAIETAISQKASEVATRLAKEKVARVDQTLRARVGFC